MNLIIITAEACLCGENSLWQCYQLISIFFFTHEASGHIVQQQDQQLWEIRALLTIIIQHQHMAYNNKTFNNIAI